jgi:putative Holliday junction resolvase
MSAPQIVMSFDFGERRIGVACGDTITRTASPVGFVRVEPEGPWTEIETLLKIWRPNLVIVGLPYNVDGSESALGSASRRFAAQIEQRFSLEVRMVDERYSSIDAQARLKSARESGLRRRRIAKGDLDAAAACVILERWFTERDRGLTQDGRILTDNT